MQDQRSVWSTSLVTSKQVIKTKELKWSISWLQYENYTQQPENKYKHGTIIVAQIYEYIHKYNINMPDIQIYTNNIYTYVYKIRSELTK